MFGMEPWTTDLLFHDKKDMIDSIQEVNLEDEVLIMFLQCFEMPA